MDMKYSFESVDIGDEFILVPVGGAESEIKGVIRANEAGNKIIQLLMQGLDEDEVVDALSKEYDDDRETLQKYVRSVIGVLQDNRLMK